MAHQSQLQFTYTKEGAHVSQILSYYSHYQGSTLCLYTLPMNRELLQYTNLYVLKGRVDCQICLKDTQEGAHVSQILSYYSHYQGSILCLYMLPMNRVGYSCSIQTYMLLWVDRQICLKDTQLRPTNTQGSAHVLPYSSNDQDSIVFLYTML